LAVDRKLLAMEREQLHGTFRASAESISNKFGARILATSGTDVAVGKEVKNLFGNVRRSVNSAVGNVVEQKMAEMQAVLKSAKIPGMNLRELEQIQNKVNRKLSGKFKGATRAQRIKVGQGLTNNRLAQEVASATSVKQSGLAKNRVQGYLTNRMGDGLSLHGGSAFRWNDRILTSEMARADQLATTEFLAKAGILGRWELDANHKKYDICDKLAEGTGEKAMGILATQETSIDPTGLYSGAEMPAYPHPYCQCHIVPVTIAEKMLQVSARKAFSQAGEDMVNYGAGFVSPSTQDYIRKWTVEEFKHTLPFTEPIKRPIEKVIAYQSRIRKQTDFGMNGAFGFKSKPLEKYIQRGGSRAYAELGKNTIGKYLAPDIVEEIGLDNAMKLLAVEIRAQGKEGLVIQSIEEYMDRDLGKALFASMKRADGLLKEAGSYRIQVLEGTPKRAIMGLRTSALRGARTELGDAIGYTEMHERLLLELKSGKGISFVNVPVGVKQRGEDLATKLGLRKSEYAMVKTKGTNFMVIDKPGISKFNAFYDTEKRATLSARLQKIRAGKENKSEWLPAYFKDEIQNKSTGKMMPFRLTKDQQIGIRFTKENKQSLIHYAPGAGKTHAAIGSATELIAEGKVKRVLIVTPGNLSKQFDEEIKEMVVGVKSRNLATSARVVRMKQYANAEPGFTVISHTQFEHDMEFLRAGGYDMVIIDEAHMIKADVLELAQDLQAKYRIAMTGTAIKDRVSDMYGMLDWLRPGLLESKVKFEAKFEDIVKASTIYEKSILRDLRDALNPLVITKKSSVKARLMHRTSTVNLSAGQRKAIAKAEHDAIELRVSGKLSKTEAEARRDRKLGKIVNTGTPEENKKFAALDRIQRTHPREKVLVFTSDKDAFKSIRAGLGEENVLYYDSSISKAQRNTLIKEFKENPDQKMMVLTDAAGATGLNLEISNIMVHWDLPNKAFKLAQREARNWRGVKTDSVINYFLQTQTAYDARIAKELLISRKITDSAVLAETLDEIGVAKTMKALLKREIPLRSTSAQISTKFVLDEGLLKKLTGAQTPSEFFNVGGLTQLEDELVEFSAGNSPIPFVSERVMARTGIEKLDPRDVKTVNALMEYIDNASAKEEILYRLESGVSRNLSLKKGDVYSAGIRSYSKSSAFVKDTLEEEIFDNPVLFKVVGKSKSLNIQAYSSFGEQLESVTAGNFKVLKVIEREGYREIEVEQVAGKLVNKDIGMAMATRTKNVVKEVSDDVLLGYGRAHTEAFEKLNAVMDADRNMKLSAQKVYNKFSQDELAVLKAHNIDIKVFIEDMGWNGKIKEVNFGDISIISDLTENERNKAVEMFEKIATVKWKEEEVKKLALEKLQKSSAPVAVNIEKVLAPAPKASAIPRVTSVSKEDKYAKELVSMLRSSSPVSKGVKVTAQQMYDLLEEKTLLGYKLSGFDIVKELARQGLRGKVVEKDILVMGKSVVKLTVVEQKAAVVKAGQTLYRDALLDIKSVIKKVPVKGRAAQKVYDELTPAQLLRYQQ